MLWLSSALSSSLRVEALRTSARFFSRLSNPSALKTALRSPLTSQSAKVKCHTSSCTKSVNNPSLRTPLAAPSSFSSAQCGRSCKPMLNSAQRRSMAYSPKPNPSGSHSNADVGLYVVSGVVLVIGLAYASVPLYRMFCQATGYGGTTSKHDGDFEKVENMVPIEERELVIHFSASTAATMDWTFKPQQRSVQVVPGETALAFFTASNPTKKAITGISTYNVVPYEAGQYFNKIQCFCFEEQRLDAGEEVDMPVFFYIDPEFAEDPGLMNVNDITLSYTFFKSSASNKNEE
eukprot:m.104220 g.104220  ORF g.104220 m.104220 type:complete len:291 (-) comp9107_c0_seq1:1153-2025(-)